MPTLTVKESIDLVQFSRDFFAQIATLNVAYLAISVGIILLFGALLAAGVILLGFRPLKGRIDKQENDIENFKKTVSKIEEIEKRMIAAESRVNATETRMINDELQSIWNQHYIFQSALNYAADILSLTTYLELSISFKKDTMACLKQIIWLLDNDPGTLPGSVNKLSKPATKISTFTRISGAFSKISGYENEKTEIITKIQSKWFNTVLPSTTSRN